jgi:Ca2+-dependent lipid-binding protein
MDPYVIVHYSYVKKGVESIVSTHQTTVKQEAGKKPTWNEVFDIPLQKSLTKSALTFMMWEKDLVYDDFIG